jgi:hypothetical protein
MGSQKEIEGSMTITWQWATLSTQDNGAAGSLAKIWEREGVKEHGVFKAQPIDSGASLMAREVIQNSWDAAREAAKEFDANVPFEIDFTFSEVAGAEKKSLIDILDLAGHSKHRRSFLDTETATRAQLGLGEHDCLDDIDDLSIPLKSLVVSEKGTTGLYGNFASPRSKMYLALVSVGFTEKASGSGGSFGYGKAGLIAGSGIRTVIAYTCFRERNDDPGVTRRLLGMTYWGGHHIGESHFSGFARFGKTVERDGRTSEDPFEDEEADDIAHALGLALRDPSNEEDIGTTFLLLDPVVDPAELSAAVCRYWWPALEFERFEVNISRKDRRGDVTEEWVPRPRKDEVLKSFIRAYELATVPQDNRNKEEYSKDLGNLDLDNERLGLGSLGLKADLDGWSYKVEVPGSTGVDHVEDESEYQVTQENLVALVRGPRMIVQYLKVGRANPPFVRGVFVASEAVDDLLKQTEPMAHHRWETDQTVRSVDPRAPKVAAEIIKRIKSRVLQFRKGLQPPVPKQADIHLPDLTRLMGRISTGVNDAPPKPPPDGVRETTIKISNDGVEEALGGTELVFIADIDIALSENFKDADEAPGFVDLSFRFVEDDRAGESCELQITPPEGFIADAERPGRFYGVLNKNHQRFSLRSAPYSPDWSGRLLVSSAIENDASSVPEEALA